MTFWGDAEMSVVRFTIHLAGRKLNAEKPYMNGPLDLGIDMFGEEYRGFEICLNMYSAWLCRCGGAYNRIGDSAKNPGVQRGYRVFQRPTH